MGDVVFKCLISVAAAAAVSALSLAPLQAPQSDAPWHFAVGAAGETHTAFTVPDLTTAPAVALPHRVHAPNTALWYGRALSLPAGGAIAVDADDGAQLFVDDRPVPAVDRTFAVPAGMNGTHAVTIRVLNNAMAGGLRAVRLLDADAYRAAAPTAQPLAAADELPPVEAPAFARRMPEANRPCEFSVWGDSQGGWSTFDALVKRMAADGGHLSIGAGDLVNHGADTDAWRRFLDSIAPLARLVPVVPVAGNHDYDGFYDTLRAEHYLTLFRPRDARPWFAWSCGPVRFMAIDVNTEFPIGISPRSTQAAWIDAEAAGRAWREARWRVLVLHQPPWSRSWAGYEGDLAVRHWVERLAATSRLDVVFAGHTHAYERLARTAGGRTVQVVITGGGGGTLEDAGSARLDGSGGDRVVVRHHYVRARATTTTLSWEAVGADGVVFDRHTIKPAAVR